MVRALCKVLIAKLPWHVHGALTNYATLQAAALRRLMATVLGRLTVLERHGKAFVGAPLGEEKAFSLQIALVGASLFSSSHPD